jgi:capsular polysaccharide biosynthesis protein
VNWHYGHFLIETLAKWWAVSEAIGEVDGFLFHVHDPQLFQKPFIQACMVGMQLEQKEIVHFNQPTLLSKVIVPQSSFQLDGHIYAKYRDTLSVIASAYFAPGSKRTEQPLYVSRRLLKGGVTQYVGEADIEDFLAKKGVRIFHPQMHAFEEQVRIFNEHAVILGIDGSGMHNIALSIDPKTAVYFTQDWIIPSSLLISRCFDAKSTFLYSSARFDRFRALSEKLSSKLPLNWHRPSDGFLRTRHLDVSRVLTWLKQSDIV